jgi:hypothetical protein
VPGVRELTDRGQNSFVKIYSERAGRATRQLIADVLIVLWTYLWIRSSMAVYDAIETLAEPGRRTAEAGDRMAQQFRDAAAQAGRVPIAGHDLAAPLNRAADASTGLADAGRQQVEVVHNFALATAIGLAVLTIGIVLLIWLPLRVAWIRRASATARLRAAPAGRDLLALRALATAPFTTLTALDPDIAGAWRRGEAAAVDRLAALQLRRAGLR